MKTTRKYKNIGKKCPLCHKRKGIKKGFRKNKSGIKQTYYCKHCKKKFTSHDLYWKKRYPKLIKQVYYMRYPYIIVDINGIKSQPIGMSLRKIANEIEKIYNHKISPTTINNYIKDIEKAIKQIKSPRWAVYREGQNFKR